MCKKTGLVFMILTLTCTQAFAVVEARKNPKNWAILVGHLIYSVNQIYWQISQNQALSHVDTPIDEDDVSLEERSCGPMCQYHSIAILDNIKQTQNLNGVATFIMGTGISFNAMASLMLAREKEANFCKFKDVAKGLTVFASFFNIAAMSYLIELEVYHRASEIPIETQAPIDYALTQGLGYLLPSLPFVGYGIASVCRYTHLFGLFLESLTTRKAPDIENVFGEEDL